MNIDEAINGWTYEETVKTAESLMEAEKNMFKWDVIRHLRDFAETYREQLKEYQQLEEQGRLMKLPCKVGDIIYEVHQLTGKITERKINSIVVCNCPDLTIMYKSGYDYSNVQEDFGKTAFLTKSEAEQKLKEMEV